MPPAPQPVPAPRISPGTYVRFRREALHLSLEDVALMLETTPGVSAQRRAEWLAMIEADVAPISLPTALALHDTIRVDLRVLAYWMALAEGARPSLVELLSSIAPTVGEGPVIIGLDLGAGPDMQA